MSKRTRQQKCIARATAKYLGAKSRNARRFLEKNLDDVRKNVQLPVKP
jgi:hypothetical protein